MTDLLHRLLSGHLHTRRVELPRRNRVSLSRRMQISPPPPRNPVFAAAGERLATSSELDTLRSLHPRRIAAVG